MPNYRCKDIVTGNPDALCVPAIPAAAIRLSALTELQLSRSNPLVSAKGPDATLKETLLAASERVGQRFSGQPDSEAAIRTSLASLFNSLDLWSQAESEARRALSLHESAGTGAAKQALQARTTLVRILSRTGQSEAAKAELDRLDKQLAGATDEQSRFWRSSARSTYLMMRGELLMLRHN